MIQQLSLRDFKGHRASTIALSPLTIFVGPNGAGKTSALEALHYLGQLYGKGFDEVFTGPRSPAAVTRHAQGVRGFSIGTVGNSEAGTQSLELDVEMKDSEEVEVDENGDEFTPPSFVAAITLGSGPPPWTRSLKHIDRSLVRWGYGKHWPELASSVLFRLDAQKIAAPAVASERTRVEYDGANTAAVLANLKLTDEERLATIVEHLREVVPQVERIRSIPTTIKTASGSAAAYQLMFDLLGCTKVPSSGVSEGTLLTLALLTALHGPSRPRLLLLDDIHDALHPSAQGRLMKVLHRLTTGDEPTQIVATTHSPYILDAVEPSAVQVFALRDDGTAAVRSLSEHPDAARYVGALSTGQLWTLDEERSWVLAGTP